MKQYINRILLLSGCALAFASCDENSWNDDYLSEFEPDQPITEVKTIEYTLTAADYKTLAGISTNKALAGEEKADALQAVGNQGYFTDVITAKEYVPAFLASTSFPYFSLNNGSAIKLTYNVAQNLPQEISAIAAAPTVTIGEEDYQMSVWESETDYVDCFAPSKPASKFLPKLLRNALPDAQAGDYVIVNYNESDVDPVFTQTPDVPAFTLSEVLGSISKGDAVDISGYVAAVSTQGPIVADASGTVFVYQPTNNSELKVGDQVEISSTVDSFNYGFQISRGSSPEIVGTQDVTYPEAKTWTGSEIDQFVADAMASGAAPIAPVYSKFTGTVAVSGTYINIKLDGTTVQVSPYGASGTLKQQLTDGATVTFEGYVMAIASKGKYLNTIITKVGEKPVIDVNSVNAVASRAVTVASENVNAVYSFDGSVWAPAADAAILSHADYAAMGQSHDNLSGETPAQVLPMYLARKFPYAQAGDHKYVAYSYFVKAGDVPLRCDYYVFDGTAWTIDNGVTTVTDQFVKSAGKWMYDPNVYIVLPVGRGVEISTLYFQTCVDWVKANVPDGDAYVSSYGNNEYYCGTSAYQGNVDLRPSAAKAQYAGYADMSDEEVVALEKSRFESEVFPAALSILHPDAVPVEGLEVLYTINFGAYQGVNPTPTYDIVYKVVGKGQFEFVSCTWNDTPAE